MPYVPLPHGRVHFAERGERREGRPSVLLIHGAGAGSAIWSMTLARVARTAHAVAIDLPGHGPSERGDVPLDMGAYRDAVGLLGATLCLGSAVLVGHSMGALVAMEAALAWPDKVRALVLVAAAPRLPVDPQLLALLETDPEAARVWLADHGLSPRAKPAVRRGMLAAGPGAPDDVARADFQLVRDTDLTARMPALRCPTVWIDGADDRIVPAESRHGRRGEIIVVPDAGHLLPIEAPAAIAAAAVAG
ncbi:MAG: alpha/beta fold hydrolase [Polyangia bacterium]